MKNKKLIVHEINCHGEGIVTYDGQSRYYCYDGDGGDMKQAINFLVDIGFIDPEEVVVFEGDDIYACVEKAVNGDA